MISAQLKELLLQSLVHEKGGVLVYRTALQCARNTALRTEWTRFLSQTETHVTALGGVDRGAGPRSRRDDTGVHDRRTHRQGTRRCHADGPRGGRPGGRRGLVACDCVSLAEAKDHADWELLGKVAENLNGRPKPCSLRRMSESRRRRTSISTTRKAGRASSGSNRWVSRPSFLRRERKSIKSASSAEEARRNR